MYVYVGAGVGGFVLIAAMAFLFRRQRNQKHRDDSNRDRWA
jgi:nitrate reductase gamma subunit